MATMQVQNVSVCDKTVKRAQNGTQVTMTNQTHCPMTLDRYHNWSGSPVDGTFPTTIYPNDSATFTHLKGTSFGSKGAVVYIGKNAANVDCSWVLAWHAPAENTLPLHPNRVFVVCDTKESIDGFYNFDRIQTYLDVGSTHSSFGKRYPKIFVEANIMDTVPDIATLVCDFKLLP